MLKICQKRWKIRIFDRSQAYSIMFVWYYKFLPLHHIKKQELAMTATSNKRKTLFSVRRTCYFLTTCFRNRYTLIPTYPIKVSSRIREIHCFFLGVFWKRSSGAEFRWSEYLDRLPVSKAKFDCHWQGFRSFREVTVAKSSTFPQKWCSQFLLFAWREYITPSKEISYDQ